MRGVTFIEILVVFAVLAVLVTIIVAGFGQYREERALAGDTERLLSTLEEARVKTLASTDLYTYGVHLQNNQFILFRGSSFDAATNTNRVFTISSDVEISSWALTGGGEDIIFDRLTGETSMHGTITLRLKKVTSRTRIVSILSSGVISSD